jgi:hypothetical protein
MPAAILFAPSRCHSRSDAWASTIQRSCRSRGGPYGAGRSSGVELAAAEGSAARVAPITLSDSAYSRLSNRVVARKRFALSSSVVSTDWFLSAQPRSSAMASHNLPQRFCGRGRRSAIRERRMETVAFFNRITGAGDRMSSHFVRIKRLIEACGMAVQNASTLNKIF